MIESNDVVVMDIDGTLCDVKEKNESYLDVLPRFDVLDKLLELKKRGYYVILYTARQMRTQNGNIGKINAITAPITLKWLEKWNIPYDEIHFGKPWCGKNGFYVDDKAIRPSEFTKLSLEEIHDLLEEEK